MRRLLDAFGPRRASASSCSGPSRATTARCNRGLAALAGRLGRAVRGDRQRPRAHARARAAAGRVRGHPRAHDARRLRAAAARQPRARARLAGGDGRALRRPSRRGGRDRAAGRDADASTSRRTSATATRAPRTTRPTARWPRSAGAVRASATRRGTALRDEARGAAGGGAAGHRRSSASPASSCCTATCSSSRARSRVEVRGPTRRARCCRPGAGAGPRSRRSSATSPGLSHVDPVANELFARALPQRGDHRAAGHRPRLPARRARGPDPARPRALRPRALGARRRLPDLPRARRDPRDRQGARAAAGRDRARRARLGGLWARDGRQGHRAGAGGGARARGPLALAGRLARRGARAAAPPLPALGRDDRRHPPADRLLPRACPRRWRAGRWCSGTRTPARTRAS